MSQASLRNVSCMLWTCLRYISDISQAYLRHIAGLSEAVAVKVAVAVAVAVAIIK